MNKCEIKELLADSVRGYLTRSTVESAILESIDNLDLSDTVQYALEDTISRRIEDYIGDLIGEVIEEVIDETLEDYLG